MAKLKGMELPRPNLASRLGTATGAALAEQIPKEVNRLRLASGLENLGQQNLEGLNPFQQISKLYGIPGATPEMINAVLPFLQQQMARQEQARFAESQIQPGAQAAVGIGQNVPSSVQTTAQGQPQIGLQTKEPVQAVLQANYQKDPQELFREAAQLSQQNPLTYPTAQAALPFVESREKTRLANIGETRALGERQTKLQSDTTDAFNKIMSQKLQKEGTATYSDVLGDLQNEFVNQALEDVKTGKRTPTDAANHYGKEALEFAKTRQNLKAIGGAGKYFTRLPSQNRSALKSIRDEYKKVGQLEAFENDLVTYHGMTDPYASYITYPINENKDINNLVSSAKKSKSLDETKIAEQIIDKIKPSDSLFSIGLGLESKGFDAQKFRDEIKRLNDKKDKLNRRQARELERPVPLPNLGDYWFFANSGL